MAFSVEGILTDALLLKWMQRRITKCWSSYREIFNQTNRDPTANGVLDRKLGVSSKSEVCQTCGKSIATCPGHFGTIHLVMPVFHIGYFNMILNILRCICKVGFLLVSNLRNVLAVCWVTMIENIIFANSSIHTQMSFTNVVLTKKLYQFVPRLQSAHSGTV